MQFTKTMSADAQKIIEIFEEEEHGTGLAIPGPKLEELIFACCKNKNNAVQVFENAGFEAKYYSEPKKVNELNIHWKTVDEPYEEFVSFRRLGSSPRIESFFSEYQVVLFIRSGHVERVWAKVDKTMP